MEETERVRIRLRADSLKLYSALHSEPVIQATFLGDSKDLHTLLNYIEHLESKLALYRKRASHGF